MYFNFFFLKKPKTKKQFNSIQEKFSSATDVEIVQKINDFDNFNNIYI